MKKAAIGIAVGCVMMTAPVLAADMAVKAPPPAPPPPTSDWTGFYVDGGVGWQHDHFNWQYGPIQPNVPWSESVGSGSLIGHIGYQQQFGWLVVGGEVGEFKSMTGKWANIFSGANPVNAPCGTALNFQCQAVINGDTKLVGGKLGVDWRDWLFYGVGGIAFDTKIATQIVNPAGALFDTSSPQTTRGWYIGAGFDYLLYKGKLIDLIGGVEYEHVMLDNIMECSVQAAATFCPGNPAGLNYSRTVSATQDAVWAKLTVKWNPFAH